MSEIESIPAENAPADNKRSGWIVSATLFVFTLLWFGFWAQYGVDPHHDGIMLKAASDVAHGQTLYAETYSHYGILTVFFQAAAIYVFGTHLLTLRYLTVIFYALSVVLLYRISRRFLSSKYRWFPITALFLQAPMYYWTFWPWSSVFSLFFSLAACQTALFCIDNPERKSPFFFAGALSILPFWFRQPCLVFELAIPAMLFIWLIGRRYSFRLILKQFSLFILGSVIISVPILLWIIFNNVTEQFVEQVILGPIQFANTKTDYDLSTNAASSRIVTIILFFLFGGVGGFYFVIIWNCIIGFIVSVYKFFVNRNDCLQTSAVIMLFLFAGLSVHQFYPCPCAWHFFFGGIIGYLALAYTIERLFELPVKGKFYKAVAAVTAVGLIILPFAATFKMYYNLSQNHPMSDFYFPINRILNAQAIQQDSVIKGMKVHKKLIPEWNRFFEMRNAIPKQNLNDPVVNFTSEGLYPLFFNNQTNFEGNFAHFNNRDDRLQYDKWKEPDYQAQIKEKDYIVVFYFDADFIQILQRNGYTVLGWSNILQSDMHRIDYSAECLHIAYRNKPSTDK